MNISKLQPDFKLDPHSAQPLYLQIADLLSSKITSHTLPAGAKLPPERKLAALFGVSRTTSINAYRCLEQQGLVETKVGSGTYVAELSITRENALSGVPWHQLFTPSPQSPLSSILRELVDTNLDSGNISLAAGMPDPAFYPVKLFQKLFNQDKGGTNKADLGHIPTEGYGPLRLSVAGLLDAKGIHLSMENIMITAGSQQGLYLISKVLLEPGDYVVVESPTFIGAHQVFQASGARVLTLPVAGAFPFALLEDYLIRYRPKLLYMIPTYHNPTGRVLPENQRRELLQLAARHRLVILEDDPYSDLYYGEEPPPSLKALDTYGGVVYLSTFSKILCPGLRIGYAAAHPALINRLALEKQYIDLHSNNLAQILICRLLDQGSLPAHLAFVRAEYKKRRDALVEALRHFCHQDLTFSLPEGGFYLWCKIQVPVLSGRLLHEAAKTGLSFVPGEAFYSTPDGEREIRLCFTTHPEHLLSEAAKRLSEVLARLARADKRKETPVSIPFRPIV
ncbi:MAG: PLP-dependent aminotransferase family protein [Peptococcaceae bacterium]|nr:PLP-dependent aminotransferase family protein [Peptococcaceae bacterium]